jgi:hypothetical protein
MSSPTEAQLSSRPKRSGVEGLALLCHPERSEAKPNAVEGPLYLPHRVIPDRSAAYWRNLLLLCHPERSEAKPNAVEGPL